MPAALRPVWRRDAGREVVNLRTRVAAGLLACVAAASAGGAESLSPARAELNRLLEAFNAGDRATYERYVYTRLAPKKRDYGAVQSSLNLHKETGGLELLEVSEPVPYNLQGWVRARDSDALLELFFTVERQPPHRVLLFSAKPGNPPDRYFPKRLTETAAIAAVRENLARKAAADKFSGAVLIKHGDTVLLREAYGFADRQKKIANRVDTRFRTATFTKMFTADAVLRLVQDGKLKLEDQIGKYIPAITGRQLAGARIGPLLSHTSGAGEAFNEMHDEKLADMHSHADYVQAFGVDKVPGAPGAFMYSNFGYILLGRVIDNVCGTDYYQYVRDVVFKPAGMTRTDSLPEEVAVEGRALGYARPPGTHPWTSARDQIGYRGMASGGAYSTIDDIARFLKALRTHKLLDGKLTNLMLEPKIERWEGESYGFGTMTRTYWWFGHWIGYSGTGAGMSADVWFSPAADYTVIVLSNFDPPAAQQVGDFIKARLPLP
jgi:CubicO group peptidase (beta-lactamase class C family)